MGLWGKPEVCGLDGLGDKKSSKRKGGRKTHCVSFCCFQETLPSDRSSVELFSVLRNPALPPGVKICGLQFFSFFLYLSQADAIYNMVGYPEFIMNSTKLDKVFNDVGKCGTVLFVLTAQTSHFASLKHKMFLSLPLFSSRWYQIFTSKTSCSTTTSRPEWLRTSWGKLPTETSESLPHPHLPAFQRGGYTLRRGHIPVGLTQQNTAAVHKCSQATSVSPPNWSLSLIRLWEGGGISDQCSSAFQTDLQSAGHGKAQRGRIDVFDVSVTLMSAWHGGSVLLFLQVEHDPADRECILQPDQEWDGAASRNTSGSIL